MEPNEIQKKLFTDKLFRAKLTAQSHPWFFSTYFSNYLTYETADLHRDLLAISEDENISLAVIVAFRNSGKSTYMTTSYPIWSVVGKQQKKFVVIASQTQYQAKVHLTNIKRELESNELLANDLGPFVEKREEWGATSLYIPKYNARITAISTEQSVRGIRHGRYRPDLIICDDVEDMASVKTREGRNKTFEWLTSEIFPAGDNSTKRIVIGNLLHEDSLLMRLKERIQNKEIDGIFREWPIMKDGKSLWPGKYPDMASIEVEKRRVGDKKAWQREYMLQIIADDDQVIDPSWIQFYDELPEKTTANAYLNSFVSVDLAISQKTTADRTAIVIVHVFGLRPEDRKYYIDKRFINKRLTHMQTIESMKAYYQSLIVKSHEKPRALVEDVAYQHAVVEQLNDGDIPTVGVKIHSDKRARLQLASPLFEQQRVFFPKTSGSAEIIQQIIGFGVEKYDDLTDAVSMAINYVQTKVEYRLILDLGTGGSDGLVYKIVYRD